MILREGSLLEFEVISNNKDIYNPGGKQFTLGNNPIQGASKCQVQIHIPQRTFSPTPSDG